MTTSADPAKQITYADAGVDVDEGASRGRRHQGCCCWIQLLVPEVIGGEFSLLGSSTKTWKSLRLVSGTDGAGTKLAGLLSFLNRHNTTWLQCVDDTVPMGAEPLFFLDYGSWASLKLRPRLSAVAEGCRKSGCALVISRGRAIRAL